MNRDADTAAETVAAYYDALRAGEPLAPFFADEPGVVKFGISERLDGHDTIVASLAEQTATTTDWTVESRDLHVTEAGAFAWYHDDVRMAWTNTDTGSEYYFETRWSGSLRRDEAWEFTVLHVSASGSVGGD